MEISNKIFVSILLVSITTGFYIAFKTVPKKQLSLTSNDSTEKNVTREHISLTSVAFAHEGTIPVTFTCNGENKSPPLTITGVPNGTKSLSLIMEDPDAPLGPFTHWILWNIPPDTKDILAGVLPAFSEQGTNSYGHVGYDGPCPPSRHRYYFTVYALDTLVGLDGKAKKKDLKIFLDGHTLGSSFLIGNFGN